MMFGVRSRPVVLGSERYAQHSRPGSRDHGYESPAKSDEWHEGQGHIENKEMVYT